MAIESMVVYAVALALPAWLVIEQLTRRERPREHEATAPRRAAPAATSVPASRAV